MAAILTAHVMPLDMMLLVVTIETLTNMLTNQFTPCPLDDLAMVVLIDEHPISVGVNTKVFHHRMDVRINQTKMVAILLVKNKPSLYDKLI